MVAARRSNLFAHILIWQLQVISANQPWFETEAKVLHGYVYAYTHTYFFVL